MTATATRSVAKLLNRNAYIYGTDPQGHAWTTDGYIAVREHVTPTSKSATIRQANFDTLLRQLDEAQGKYQPATAQLTYSDGRHDAYIGLTANRETAYLDKEFLQAIQKAYPKAKAYVKSWNAPVLFLDGSELVAVIMPVRVKE